MTEIPFVPPPVVAHAQYASDGSAVLTYSPEDADGLREGRRYDREGDAYVLRWSATYRRTAADDGASWEIVPGSVRHH